MKPSTAGSRDLKLREILLDRETGAEELLEAALAWLRSHPESLETQRRAATLASLRETRPAMAGFATLADQLERVLAASDTSSLRVGAGSMDHTGGQ